MMSEPIVLQGQNPDSGSAEQPLQPANFEVKEIEGQGGLKCDGTGRLVQSQEPSDALDTKERCLQPVLAVSGGAKGTKMPERKHRRPKRKSKVAKGARDFGPAEMTIRERLLKVIVDVFERHEGEALKTPVFEQKGALDDMYGEESKLMYDLADQGGEILALRYDHTAPLARHVAQNNLTEFPRYTFGDVYRRDQPGRGRSCEFGQADFDFVGEYAPMIADAEILEMMSSILSELEIGKFIIKVSHRKLLDAMLTYCGVPKEKFHPICSAIDKLEKKPWAEVRTEMVEQKGFLAEAADRIKPFTEMEGSMRDMIRKLKAYDWAMRSAEAKETADAALKDMDLLLDLLEAMGGELSIFSFDLRLARGLDYYTGLIYEAVLVLPQEEHVGSVAAGGRYDGMVGQYSSRAVPCVGVSLGVERLFVILERKALRKADELGASIKKSKSQVRVVSPGSQDFLVERLKLVAQIRSAKIPAGTSKQIKPGFMDEIKRAEKDGIPVVVIMGEEELRKGVVKVRNQWREKEHPHREMEVPQPQLVEHLLQIIAENGSRNAPFTKPYIGSIW